MSRNNLVLTFEIFDLNMSKCSSLYPCVLKLEIKLQISFTSLTIYLVSSELTIFL